MNSRAGQHALILIGPSGSGKTAVGLILADLLQVPFDDPAQAFPGADVTHAFVQDPQAAENTLREHALASLATLSSSGATGVLELSPSAPSDPHVISALEQARQAGAVVVHLDAALDVLARRSGLNAAQPGNLGTPRAWFRQLHAALAQSYAGVADIRVDTGGLTPEQVAAQVSTAAGSVSSHTPERPGVNPR